MEEKRRPYAEIMKELESTPYGKSCRKIHKELKKYYGGGLPMYMRYPFLPEWISGAALVMSIVALIVQELTR